MISRRRIGGLLALAAALHLCGPASARGGHFGRPDFLPGGRGSHGHGHARIAVYDIVTLAIITDKAAADKAMAALNASIGAEQGRVLVDAGTPLTATGNAPAHTAIIAFSSTADASAWKKSAAYQSASAALQKAATSNIIEFAGIADPGPPLTETAGGKSREGTGNDIKLPPMPTIKDICTGC
jgi:uncharacterized protein (DUF1330 family)